MKVHDVQKIEFEGNTMLLFVDGKSFRIAVNAVSERLAHAGEAARKFYRVSPSGYGIHWPEVDEDLSVDGLIRAASYPSPQSGAAVLRETKE